MLEETNTNTDNANANTDNTNTNTDNTNTNTNTDGNSADGTITESDKEQMKKLIEQNASLAEEIKKVQEVNLKLLNQITVKEVAKSPEEIMNEMF